jgi:hypothetical protein
VVKVREQDGVSGSACFTTKLVDEVALLDESLVLQTRDGGAVMRHDFCCEFVEFAFVRPGDRVLEESSGDTIAPEARMDAEAEACRVGVAEGERQLADESPPRLREERDVQAVF